MSELKGEEIDPATDNSTPSSEPDMPQPACVKMSLPREIAFIALTSSAQLLTQAGLGQAVTPMLIIGKSFDISNPGDLAWFAAAYSLTVGTFILPSGRLGDVYGHKKIFIIGWLWFSFWSLLAGFSVYVEPLSQRQIYFDVMRALQGIGPALMIPNALAILGRTYEEGKRKNMAFALFGATAPCGFVVGAIFSSIFAQLAWWPWAYWAMAIACLVLGLLSIVVIPAVDEHEFRITLSHGGRGFRARWEQLDALGMITGVIGLILINFAWNQGPLVDWLPYTYSLLIVGIIFLLGFAWVERTAAFPLIPLEALKADTAFVLACIAAGWGCFGIWLFYTWQIVLVEKRLAPLIATAHFLPVVPMGIGAAVTTGLILHRAGPAWTMLGSMCAFCIGSIIMATAPVHSTYWPQFFISIIIMPWGMDMSFPSATILLSNNFKREHQGVAASLINTVLNYSVSIGLGIAGTVQTQVDKDKLHPLKGYRAAYYVGISLTVVGVAISLAFVMLHSGRKPPANEVNKKVSKATP